MFQIILALSCFLTLTLAESQEFFGPGFRGSAIDGPPGRFGVPVNRFVDAPGNFGGAPIPFGARPGAFGGAPGAFAARPGAFGGPSGAFGAGPGAFGGPPGQFGAGPGSFSGAPGTFGGVPFGAGPGALGSRPGALGGVGALGGPPRAFGGEIVAFGVAPAPGGSFGRSPALIGNNFGGSPFGPAPFAANQDPIGFGTPGGFGPERGAFGPGVVEVPQHYGARPIYGRAPAAPYQFGYGVEASDYNGGASFSLNQNFDGVLTTGRYNVNLPGGSYQSVSYSS